jgi:DNA-binding CsgD family transcriptional regulator
MTPIFSQMDALDDIGAVLGCVRETCLEEGVMRMSYHVTPLFAPPTSKTTSVYAEGFSEEWMELYADAEFRAKDPIPERVMRYGALMTWKEAMEAGPNTPENLEYFAAMKAHGLEHGFGLPLFGPRARDAYASFDFGKPVEQVPEKRLDTVRGVAQAGHHRIGWLIDRNVDVPKLSVRETEVLRWVALGKSTSSIAAILDLSPDTVKTYAKRIYAKLDANDRIGAVVKALRLGLVRI